MNSRWHQIRQLAADLRAHYAEALGSEPPFPLDVSELAEQVCELSAFPDPTLDPQINGELNSVTQSIRLRMGMSEARQRFIIAHELGHFALEGAAAIMRDDDTTIDERAGGADNSEDGVQGVYNTRERHEQEANLFALELLLPAEIIWQVYLDPAQQVQDVAAAFGVSLDAARQQICNVFMFQPMSASQPAGERATSFQPDAEQQAAVAAPTPTLVIAGPGTGKTRSIVAKYAALIDEGVDPAAILALTFSNKAAEEMRTRIIAALHRTHPAVEGRVEISTFHAWGLNFLKEYGAWIGLPLNIQLRATGDLFVLLRRRLAELPLEQYKTLHDPGMNLRAITRAIGRAKDELCSPAEYHGLAEAEAVRLVVSAEAETAGKTTKGAAEQRDKAHRQAARLRELSAIYEQYEQLLRAEGALDYGDLIMLSVRALQHDQVARAIHARYQYILVDEFQDINYASGQLIALLDGGRGRVWAVGDPWQSIYRFRGASAANLASFPMTFPGTTEVPLVRNYRSQQAILDASHAVMSSDPRAASRQRQQAQRAAHRPRPVVEWACESQAAEYAAIAHDILRQVGGRRLRHARCSWRAGRPAHRISSNGVHPRTHRPRWRDHAVLCRTHRQVRAIVSVLEGHGIPVNGGGELLDYAEVQDALAICAVVRSINNAGLLRALTTPEFLLTRDDLELLVQNAHAEKRALQRVTRDDTIVMELSPDGQSTLEALYRLHDDLSAEQDAWRVLTRYLLDRSPTMRERMRRAAQGDAVAQRELANLGQLILLARTFVRQAPPDERDAQAFITYLRLLLEAGESPEAAPLPDGADAVRVLTIHKAKGLEFPIVYVPGLQKDVFPPRKHGSVIPELPALVHGVPESSEQEESYLLYVAMTRARDRLVLSRASRKDDKQIERSQLLPADAPWTARSMVARRSCRSSTGDMRLRSLPIDVPTIAASSLDTYKQCPRRYFYQYGYQLFDDESPYLRAHQTIRKVADQLAELAQTGELPADEAALHALIRQAFARNRLTDALYADEYFDEVLRQSEPVWSSLRADPTATQQINQQLRVPCGAGTIDVRIDRLERTPGNTSYTMIKSGRPKDDDMRSTRAMLYTLAARTHDRDARVTIYYTATGERRPITPRPATMDRHITEIEELVSRIAAGHWEPHFDRHCDRCPFNLICPV